MRAYGTICDLNTNVLSEITSRAFLDELSHARRRNATKLRRG